MKAAIGITVGAIIVIVALVVGQMVGTNNREDKCRDAVDEWIETGEEAPVLDEPWCPDILLER